MNKKVLIKQTRNRGKGVFATTDLHIGELVVSGKLIKKVSKRTSHSFQLGPNYHIQLDIISRTINHSCCPNTGIRNNFYGAYDFIALNKIAKGTEITWDYETSEYISIAVKKCECSNTECRRKTKGFKYLDKKIVTRYGEFISDYLKDKK